jgi:AcrR family transcriptional regulator
VSTVSSPDDLPPPPGSPRRRRGAARRVLTREAIVDAAMELLDAGGLGELNMRAVADKLGTGPASLYAHVSGKEELLGLLIDRVSGEVKTPVIGAAPWQDQIKDMIRDVRGRLAAHRDLAHAALGVVPSGPNALVLIEAMLGVMRESGLPDQTISYAVDILALYANATAYEESLRAEQEEAGEDREGDWIAEMRAYFTSLPADRFPNLKAMAVPLTTTGAPDARFEFGLEALVRGIESMLPKKPA